jgi:nicotinamide-nucleotide amidase
MPRPISAAAILVVGSELTTGATRDSNGGDIARELTELGLSVRRISALPDDLALVTGAFAGALADAELVVSTGGLGPTPDDLTREAIAAACELEPEVDPKLEQWLRALFGRRGLEMPEANLKQAWLVPGAEPLGNERGTAPGWWLDRPDGRVIVALPGPPAEMWPMWRSDVLPRLQARSAGAARASHTLRLTGAGESMLVGLIGEELLRQDNPQVATYARPDAVDVRVSALGATAASARELVDSTVSELIHKIGSYVFAHGEVGWLEVLSTRLGARSLATVEIGTAGQLLALLGTAPFLRFGQLLRSHAAGEHAQEHLELYAERIRETSAADIGLAVLAREQAGDTQVNVAIVSKAGTKTAERTAFLTGEQGRRRAAIAACAVLWQWLGELGDGPEGER